jgi:hypothetical protein
MNLGESDLEPYDEVPAFSDGRVCKRKCDSVVACCISPIT